MVNPISPTQVMVIFTEIYDMLPVTWAERRQDVAVELTKIVVYHGYRPTPGKSTMRHKDDGS